MREIRVSRIEPKFIEYQGKKASPDPLGFKEIAGLAAGG
jgi:hypothetical protein